MSDFYFMPGLLCLLGPYAITAHTAGFTCMYNFNIQGKTNTVEATYNGRLYKGTAANKGTV